MSAQNDGGPAFPVQEWNPEGSPATLTLGLSVRDYFAAKAMQSAIRMDMAHSTDGMLDLARYAYAQADAMLKAREVKP